MMVSLVVLSELQAIVFSGWGSMWFVFERIQHIRDA